MIRVTVEIVPYGVESRKREIGVLEIANDGTGTHELGNYIAVLNADYGVRKGQLTEFKRKSQSVWSLIGAFLKLWGHTKHSPKLMSVQGSWSSASGSHPATRAKWKGR